MTEPNAALVGRDELREAVADGLMDAIGLEEWEHDDTFTLYADDLYPAVDKVIALVQAARDAEIRERMDAIQLAQLPRHRKLIRMVRDYALTHGGTAESEGE